jgi:hypothetical protein
LLTFFKCRLETPQRLENSNFSKHALNDFYARVPLEGIAMISNDWTVAALKEFEESNDDAPAFYVPVELTHSADAFFHHQVGALTVVLGMIRASVFADNAAFVAKKIVRCDVDLPQKFDPSVPLSKEIGPHRRQLDTILPSLMEMVLIRLADNFTAYLLEIVGECIKARPELLKSSKDQVTTETILSFANFDDLRSAIIERKLISIAYLSFEKQLDWVAEHLGAAELAQRGCIPSLLELIEARNCMVHNRSRIGAKYLKCLSRFGVSASMGQPLRPSIEYLFVAAKAAADFVAAADQILSLKFRLELRGRQS